MAGRSSYLRSIAHRSASNIPLLKPPRTLARREPMPSPDEGGETPLEIHRQEALPRTLPSSSPVTDVPSQGVPTSRQAQDVQHVQHVQEVRQTAPMLKKTSASETRMEPIVRTASPASVVRSLPLRETALPASAQGGQKADAAVPAKPLATSVSPRQRARTVHEKEPPTVPFQPSLKQQAMPTLPPSNATVKSRSANDVGRREDKAFSALERRPELPTREKHASVHIGTIDVQIVPPAVPQPVVRHPMPRSPRPASALSRDFPSSIGLRQA